MDASDYVGKYLSRGQFVHHPHLRSVVRACYELWFDGAEADRFAELAQALAKDDRALADQILLRWGIRR